MKILLMETEFFFRADRQADWQRWRSHESFSKICESAYKWGAKAGFCSVWY